MSNSTAEEHQNTIPPELTNDNLTTKNDNATSTITTTTTSTDILAKGISSMLSSVIRDFDTRAVSTSNSQRHLTSSLDRLTSELDQLLEDAPMPFIMQHAAKLSNVKKRVSSLNSVLRSIQRRLDNIDRMVSVGIENDQAQVGGSE